MVEVIDNFPGAMIDSWNVRRNIIRINKPKEKITISSGISFDYNLHFNFGIRNNSSLAQSYKVKVDHEPEKFDAKFNKVSLWVSGGKDNPRTLKKFKGYTDFLGSYIFTIEVSAKSDIYLSNFNPLDNDLILKNIDKLSNNLGFSKRVIGKSVLNNPIFAYEYVSNPDNPFIFVTSGFHPPERDTLSVLAILELLEEDLFFFRDLTKSYNLSLIPVVNPDGFLNKMQGSNFNEINFHWRFFGNSFSKCPEAFYIWRYVCTIKPVLYFDFHSYTFQSHKRPGSYVRPYFLYKDSKKRNLVKRINNKAIALCGGKFYSGRGIYNTQTLIYQIFRRFQAVTVAKFHIHQQDGILSSKNLTKDLFLNVSKEFLKERLNERDSFHSRLRNHFHSFTSEIYLAFRIKIYPYLLKNYRSIKW